MPVFPYIFSHSNVEIRLHHKIDGATYYFVIKTATKDSVCHLQALSALSNISG